MVQLPGKNRPEASDVIAKLMEIIPNLCNEKIEIPVIPDIEDSQAFWRYGQETSEEFTGIRASKQFQGDHAAFSNKQIEINQLKGKF